MKTIKAGLSLAMLGVLAAGMANAMPLNSSARAVIPADLQQLISVDYRALRDSPTATALKAANYGFAGKREGGRERAEGCGHQPR